MTNEKHRLSKKEIKAQKKCEKAEKAAKIQKGKEYMANFSNPLGNVDVYRLPPSQIKPSNTSDTLKKHEDSLSKYLEERQGIDALAPTTKKSRVRGVSRWNEYLTSFWMSVDHMPKDYNQWEKTSKLPPVKDSEGNVLHDEKLVEGKDPAKKKILMKGKPAFKVIGRLKGKPAARQAVMDHVALEMHSSVLAKKRTEEAEIKNKQNNAPKIIQLPEICEYRNLCGGGGFKPACTGIRDECYHSMLACCLKDSPQIFFSGKQFTRGLSLHADN